MTINDRLPAVLGVAALALLATILLACGRSSQNSAHQIPDLASRGDNVVYEVGFNGL